MREESAITEPKARATELVEYRAREDEGECDAFLHHQNQVYPSMYATSTIQNARGKENISPLALSPSPSPPAAPRNLLLT